MKPHKIPQHSLSLHYKTARKHIREIIFYFRHMWIAFFQKIINQAPNLFLKVTVLRTRCYKWTELSVLLQTNQGDKARRKLISDHYYKVQRQTWVVDSDADGDGNRRNRETMKKNASRAIDDSASRESCLIQLPIIVSILFLLLADQLESQRKIKSFNKTG